MALRCVLITQYPFREDEAVYGYWALHLLHEDPLFLTVWPDKPPIHIWLLSAAFWFFGVGEFSARTVSISASVLTIPVVAATANRLWGRQAGLMAAMAMALNPFVISFAPTAYTDSVLVFWGALAFYLVLSGHLGWAGLSLGLAIMTKQQGLLYAPLALGPLLMSPRRLQSWGRLAGGLALVTLPLLIGDSFRWAVAPSPWDLSVRNYGALTLLPPSEWGRRFSAWLEVGWYLLDSPVGWLLVSVGMVISIMLVAKGSIWGNRKGAFWVDRKDTPLLWAAGFAALHVVASVQIWDRYLLPLVPVLALLIGWTAATLLARISTERLHVVGASLFLVTLLGLPSWRAAQGKLPIGGDHGDLAGLHEALAWIEGEQGADPIVLYHQSIGPQYRFYLYEQVRRGEIELRWYPHATYLVDNAVKVPHRRKFMIQPDWASYQDLSIHAASRHIETKPMGWFGHFRLIELTVNQGVCDWCICQVPLPKPLWQ